MKILYETSSDSHPIKRIKNSVGGAEDQKLWIETNNVIQSHAVFLLQYWKGNNNKNNGNNNVSCQPNNVQKYNYNTSIL